MRRKTSDAAWACLPTLAALLMIGCDEPSESKVSAICSDLTMFLEGKDDGAMIRHIPNDPSDMVVTTGSGRNMSSPDTVADAEAALDDMRDILTGEDITLTQESVSVEGETARANLTYRVEEAGQERLVPVRIDVIREGDSWVVTEITVYD